MSSSRLPVRTLAAACGVVSVCAAPATAEAAHRPASLLTVPGLSSTLRSSPLSAEGFARLVARTRHADALIHRRHEARPWGSLRITARGIAKTPANAPWQVRRMIAAANRISHTPYVWGGGHGNWDAAGYDCSGSVGYVLHAAGLLDTATTSGALTTYGQAGKGRWVTVYANGGHTYMVIAGVRYDTSAAKVTGTRWSRELVSGAGYTVRHPAGL